MATKKIKYLVDEVRHEHYVRAWAEGRGRNREIMVHVWKGKEPVGDPQGDWAMPAVFGLDGCIHQAVLQTK
jgi:hypothetical protein